MCSHQSLNDLCTVEWCTCTFIWFREVYDIRLMSYGFMMSFHIQGPVCWVLLPWWVIWISHFVTKARQCKTIVTFDTIPESKILDAGDLLILSNLQKPWTIACKDVSRVLEIEYSTYHILNRLELCECSLTAGNYLLSYTNINCGNAPEARDGYFTTYYSFNKIVLDVITENLTSR